MSDSSPIPFNYKKAVQAVNFFASKSPDRRIDKLKVLKLIWLADRYHIRKYGRPITGDTYFAMKLGPVASSVKDLIELDDFLTTDSRDYSKQFLNYIPNRTVISKTDINEKVLSETDLEALNFIFVHYSTFDTLELAKYTHKFPEWSKFEGALNAGVLSREMSYLDFFENPPEGDKLFDEPQDLLEANKEVVKEEEAISGIFS